MNKRYQLALLLLSIAGAAMAQQSDSHLVGPGKRGNFNGLSHIEVDLGQKNAVVVGFTTFSQVTARQNIDSVLRLFVADHRKIADTSQSQAGATHVLYRLGPVNRTADVHYLPPAITTFRFAAGQPDPVLVKTRQDTLQIVWSEALMPLAYYDFSVYLLINNLSDLDRILREGGVNSNLQEALQLVRQYKGHDLTNPKMAFDLRYRREGESIQTQFINPGLAKSPYISFQPGVGVGLIRTQWVPSLNLDVQFIPNRFKGAGYSVGYLLNFHDAKPSEFLTVGVSFYRNRTNQPGPAFDNLRTSFSVGVLVRSANSVFSKGTIRLSGTLYQKGFIKIQPEFYFNGGTFKEVFPGVRIGFGL